MPVGLLPDMRKNAPPMDGNLEFFGFRAKNVTANYTVLRSDSGTIFDTVGATAAVTFTLPPREAGLFFVFFNGANQNMTIDAGVAHCISFNNLTRQSLAFSTTNEKSGAWCIVWCSGDGSKWLYMMPNVANTLTWT